MEKALSLIRGITDPGLALNRLREYLQAFIFLGSLCKAV